MEEGAFSLVVVPSLLVTHSLVAVVTVVHDSVAAVKHNLVIGTTVEEN